MYYRQLGNVPRKRHTLHRDAAGDRLHEELMGQAGFSSRSALLYHRRSPSALVAVEPLDTPSTDAAFDHPSVPRHLQPTHLAMPNQRVALLENSDVAIGWWVATKPTPLYRNACGDELLYVHSGTATLETVFGALRVGVGDYVVIPAATTYRLVPNGSIGLLTVESGAHIDIPAKYLTTGGQFQEHAPFCERDLRAPTTPLVVADDALDQPTDIIVRTAGGLSKHTMASHPFDVVGWDGQLYPWVFNIADFEPIVGSLHQPPPVHQTFAGPGFVVCSFVPRPFDFHPDAVKVPYYHANTDSDEVLFYADGDFMSRAGSGITAGSMSFHPAGFVHGPQPGSYEGSIDKRRTEEIAVMIDTFAPLRVSAAARSVSAEGYEYSWRG